MRNGRLRRAFSSSTMFSAGGIAVALAGAGVLLAPGVAQAQSSWTGGDSNWNDPSYWIPAPPASNTDVEIIDGTATIAGSHVTVHDIHTYGGGPVLAGISVVNGGTLNANYLMLADAGGFGRLSVSGPGSSIHLARIGASRGDGESRILVTQGGTLRTDIGISTIDTNPLLSINVEDTGSLLDFGTELQLGRTGGGGTLLVDNGARLAGNSLELGGISRFDIGTGTSYAVGSVQAFGTNAIRAFNTGVVTLGASLGEAGGGRLAVSMNAAGTLRLTGNSDYTGATTIASGTIAALGAGKNSIGDQSNVVISAGGRLSLTSGVPGGVAGAEDDDETIGSLNGAGTVTLGNQQLSVADNSQNSDYSGVISGSGSIRKTGSTTLQLRAANSYAGGTFIDGGIVQMGANQALGTGSLTLSGGSLTTGSYQQTVTSLSGTAGSQVVLGTGSVLTTGTAADSNYAGTISGSGTLAKAGTGALALSGPLSGTMGLSLAAGRLTLAGANSLSGDTHISGTSTLVLASDAALGTGRLLVDGGTPELQANGTRRLANAVLIDRADASLIVTGSDSLRLDGALQATGTGSFGNLIKRGTGNLTLTGANTINGLSLEQGTLTIGRMTALGNGPLSVADGTMLRFDTHGTFESFTRAVTLGAGQARFDVTSDLSSYGFSVADLSGPVSGSGGILLTGGGTLNLGGTNSFTGDVVVRSGELQLDGGNALADSVSVTLENGGSMSFYGDETIGSLEGSGVLNLYLYGASLGANNRSTTFAGDMIGSARLHKVGTGALTLTGAQSHTGSIDIEQGELRVESMLASANVNLNSSTARLSGNGTIAGAVNNFGGGTLVGVAGQTLHMGSLVLGDFGSIDVTLGAAGSAALFDVAGNVTLAGRINVTDAGGFGAGVYRLIDYGGTLTRRTTSLGTLPAGITAADLQLQTSVAGQVNLISTWGLDLLFWDGGNAALYNNGAVNGGSGIWTATSASWTDPDGLANGAMRPLPGFAIFEGSAGTVTADASAGALSVTGMQFVVGGYRLEGAAIGLAGTGGRTTIRVGDGTAAGSGYTTTIAASLSGATDLVKGDLGTLILAGANGYANTIVEGGTLIGNAASIRGDIANAATLVFDQASDAVFAGAIVGSGGADGTMVKRGSGALSLTGASSLDWTIEAGTLAALAAGFTGDTQISGGATLALSGGASSSSSATYSGALTGTGTFATSGNGTLTLSGNNAAFAGTTLVSAGTLDVTGTLGGDVSVQSGGTLGGTGNVGAVQIGSGGRLGGVAGTTLSLASLDLASGATLDVMLGNAGDPALFAVAGNLVLDGTVNVSAASLEGGIYRLISYGGALTDNGLAIGTTPAGLTAADLFVQTGIAGQVNLIATNGIDLRFWDGGNAASHDNGAIDGGDGIWSAGTRSWTDVNGALNGAMQPMPGFAVFATPGGQVTIDDSAGAVGAAGLQFAADGYVLSGDALVLAGKGGQTVIRVGDGSAAGAGYTATIAANLTGNSALVKTDLGTLSLDGSNGYTGDTIIQAGTLSIASNSALGTGGSLILTGGNLAVRASMALGRAVQVAGGGFDIAQGTQLTLSGSLAGSGALIKRGLGTLRLDGSSDYAGDTRVEAGTLIGDAARLRGNVANAGTLVFDQLADASFAGVIAGLGSVRGGVVKRGAGTLSLSGANSLDWTIEAGSLRADMASFAGNLAIADGAGLLMGSAGDASYGHVLSGGGAITKTGSGALTLAGDSSAFAGTTRVAEGRLDITGQLGGTLAVANGATLGGTGTLGAVTIEDGATLAGRSGATLTLGALDLASGAHIAAALGSPDDTALFAVTGDLTLGGTILITDAGGFGAGVYRLFDYGGALVDRGLAIGSTPGSLAAADLLVQTSVAGRINLINTNGLSLSFWDGGAAVGHDNGRVDGGAGTWRADGRAWTDATGVANGRYQPIPSLAIFQGSGGTVTTDNAAGALSVTGLQFAADGYRLEGDALGLAGTGGRTAIRVGDGSAAGAGYTAVIDSALNGSSDLVKTDLGTLILTGANSYTGNTLVEAGTLVGAVGSIRGNVAAAGTMVFDQAADAAFAGNVDGLNGTRGAAVKRGPGTLSLAGTTSLDWRIESGGLVTRTQAFTGNVAIAGGASLAFDQANAGSYAGQIGGSGALRISGGGAISLTGDSRGFTGNVDLVKGSLSVAGTLGGVMTIGAGGVLHGNGTLGSVTIGAGGILAPGNSIGTLTIAGNLSFAPGAVYQVEVDPLSAASDGVVVEGRASLAGSVAHIGMTGAYQPLATYTILTATGGIDGSFGGVTSSFAFLDPTLGYTANTVTLTLERNDINFAAVAATRNQRAAAAAAETLGSGNAIYDALVVLDAPEARGAFDQLAGAFHSSLTAQLSQDSNLVRASVLGRARDPMGDPGVQPWVQGVGAWGRIEGDGNAALIQRSAGGALFGFDAVTNQDVRLALFGGYERGDVDGGRGDTATVDSYHVGLSADARLGAASLRAGYAYSWHDVAARRQVGFTGFADQLRAEYGASTAQIFGEAAYGVQLDAGTSLHPFAQIAHVAVNAEAAQELGEAASLRLEHRSLATTQTILGVQALSAKQGHYTVRTSLGWQHALQGQAPAAGAFLGGTRFEMAGVRPDRDAFVGEAAVTLQAGAGWAVDLAYSGTFARRVQDHVARARITWRF